MLIFVEEVVFVHMFNNMLPQNFFKNLDEMGGERNWSIVGSVSTTVTLVNWSD